MPVAWSRVRRFIALGAASVALVLTGCTDAPPPNPGPPAGLPPGVHVEVYQNRFDYAARVLEIRVANESDTDLDVVSAAFESPRFAGAAVYDAPVLIDAGRTIDLRVKLPEVVCGDDGNARDAVVLTWRDGGGTESESLEPADDNQVVDRIVAEDCVTQAVDEVVTIEPPTVLRIDGEGPASVAWVDVTVTPTGNPGTVTIDRVGATVLLTSVSGLDWPAGFTMDAAAPPRTIPLDLRPTRCDPHAVAEDKRGTVFPLAVSTSAGFSGTYDLVVPDALRSQIYEWIGARCGTTNAG
ncbi:MAG TPA: hypothetical protein VEX88_09525 [Glaciibacter sp.]|nr:hypothetical protein [Glaciibacter sp.]